jgi:hypothetical protein
MSTVLSFTRVALAALTLGAALAAQAQTVSIHASHTDAAIGDTIDLTVDATGFPDKVFGGGYNLAFDPTMLQLDRITFPANWEFITSPGLFDAASGTVSDIYFNTFVNPIKGDFLTATLHFTVVGAGTSMVTLSDSPSFPFGDEFANPVAVSYVGATVAAVPEPSSLALLLAGAGAVATVSRRRQRR